MAKKSRRKRREKVAKQPTTRQTAQQGETLSSSTAQDVLDFTEDYHYVYTDVRILLVVTVIMIVLILGLSYLI
ncbi:MAG: hypothetical protein GWO38_29830 [Phycisphaerae bacterium]|nr:hypothetical protein [Phycisphaerae bacterium]NIX31716.1 hypothetical protein [Phycisphaerae bacterium]